MLFEKYADIIERLSQLIHMRNTGTPDELAQKIGISSSSLYEILDIMKDRGAKIEYDRHLETYYYVNDGGFDFHFIKKK